MRRFWTHAAVDAQAGGHAIMLDGRSVRTPARAPLQLPTAALAAAVSAEWAAVGEQVDPRAMPLTGLANAAIDIITPAPHAFADGLCRYAEADLLCYRSDDAALAAEQARVWNPILGWAEGAFDVEFTLTDAILHVAQPDATVARLSGAVRALPPFALAAVSPLVTLSGSLVMALAVEARAFDSDALWDAATLDERWQEERWGSDDEALAARAARKAEWDSAVRFLELL